MLVVIVGVGIYGRKKERDKALKLSPLVTVRPPKKTSIARSGEIIPSPGDFGDDDDDDGAGLSDYFDIEMQLTQDSPRDKLSSESAVALSNKEGVRDSDSSNHSQDSTGSITARTHALITFLEDGLMVDHKKDDDSKKDSVESTGAPPHDMTYHSSRYDTPLTLTPSSSYTIDGTLTQQILRHLPFGVNLGVNPPPHKAPTEHPQRHVKLLLTSAHRRARSPVQKTALKTTPRRIALAQRPAASRKRTTAMRTKKV